MDDDIGQPGFVFQRDEDNACRRPWPLSSDDDAGGADQGAMARRFQRCGRDEAPFCQTLTQQGQRMAAQGQAKAAVIGDEIFPFARRRQIHRHLSRWEAGEQIALYCCIFRAR